MNSTSNSTSCYWNSTAYDKWFNCQPPGLIASLHHINPHLGYYIRLLRYSLCRKECLERIAPAETLLTGI
ncbi:uncharacterized protein RAG0_05241 [Rhynchosporium agropyri]|uniref:Uncharacterized protein n=1 Tax=Rhynchosporium agropyri TaxID=914238 RepID=A0A1E1KC72_9HELO|nr:uncharacterized protein RAG0_05241 [Rhynchosporium agropyri]